MTTSPLNTTAGVTTDPTSVGTGTNLIDTSQGGGFLGGVGGFSTGGAGLLQALSSIWAHGSLSDLFSFVSSLVSGGGVFTTQQVVGSDPVNTSTTHVQVADTDQTPKGHAGGFSDTVHEHPIMPGSHNGGHGSSSV